MRLIIINGKWECFINNAHVEIKSIVDIVEEFNL